MPGTVLPGNGDTAVEKKKQQTKIFVLMEFTMHII